MKKGRRRREGKNEARDKDEMVMCVVDSQAQSKDSIIPFNKQFLKRFSDKLNHTVTPLCEEDRDGDNENEQTKNVNRTNQRNERTKVLRQLIKHSYYWARKLDTRHNLRMVEQPM